MIEKLKANVIMSDSRYGGCSQSVLSGLQDALRLGNVESFKSASILAGGVAREGETCGALIAALMALGLAIGRERMEDETQYDMAMDIGREVRAQFQEELRKQFGLQNELKSTLCRDIQAIVLGRPFNLWKEHEAFMAAGAHDEDCCPKVCAIAAQVAAEKILEIRCATR